MIDIEELKERIRLKYDPDDLIDLLHITVEDILNKFGHRIEMYRDNFTSEEYWEND